MSNQLNDPSSLLPFLILGAEDDNASSSDPAGSEGDSQSSGGEDGKTGSSSSKEVHDDANDPKVQGLKSALQKERQGRQADADELKELRKLKKQHDEAELAKKSDIDQARIKAEAAEEKATKLATGFLNRELNLAIVEAARGLDFIDADDALAGVDRSGFTFTQDEDDPSNVTIDKKTIEAAVKSLATKKPHFVKAGTDDGKPSGSQFGGPKKKQQTSDEALKEKYPSLR